MGTDYSKNRAIVPPLLKLSYVHPQQVKKVVFVRIFCHEFVPFTVEKESKLVKLEHTNKLCIYQGFFHNIFQTY